MKIVKNKMRIIMIQESSLILENKPKAFATKEKILFILPLLLKCEGSGPLPSWRGACLDHSSPMSFLILCRVLLCGLETLQLSRRSTWDMDIFSNVAVSCSVRSRSMRNLLNLFNNPSISSFPMVMNILKVKNHHVKHFLLFSSIFLFLNTMIKNKKLLAFKCRKEN